MIAIRLLVALLLVAGLVPAVQVVQTVQAPSAAAAPGAVKLSGYGADSCTAPSLTQMNAFWKNTRFSYWGIYLGGLDRACAQPNLTTSWINSVLAMGWHLLPIWVGVQNPCTPGQSAYFSRNASISYTQGETAAISARRAWTALQSSSSVPIDVDLESPSVDTTVCRTATKAFVRGWVDQLHAGKQTAGVYTSTCGGFLQDFATIAQPPDFVDGAQWDNNPSTRAYNCVSASYWTLTQRHKQYQGGHNQTDNGVTLNIDSRCAYGPTYGNKPSVTPSSPCH